MSRKVATNSSAKKVTDEPVKETVEPIAPTSQETVQEEVVAEKQNNPTMFPKEECPKEISDMERKVLSLCVCGAWSNVANLLKGYKWRDPICSRIAGACNYCVRHQMHVCTSQVQLALLKLYPNVKTEISYVTKSIIAPNLLLPLTHKLLNTK